MDSTLHDAKPNWSSQLQELQFSACADLSGFVVLVVSARVACHWISAEVWIARSMN